MGFLVATFWGMGGHRGIAGVRGELSVGGVGATWDFWWQEIQLNLFSAIRIYFRWQEIQLNLLLVARIPTEPTNAHQMSFYTCVICIIYIIYIYNI